MFQKNRWRIIWAKIGRSGSYADTPKHCKPANVRFRPKTVIRGVDLRSIEDTAVIELLLTRPERKVER
jgi:hypothetical protein